MVPWKAMDVHTTSYKYVTDKLGVCKGYGHLKMMVATSEIGKFGAVLLFH